jgi:hypothetical protein
MPVMKMFRVTWEDLDHWVSRAELELLEDKFQVAEDTQTLLIDPEVIEEIESELSPEDAKRFGDILSFLKKMCEKFGGQWDLWID